MQFILSTFLHQLVFPLVCSPQVAHLYYAIFRLSRLFVKGFQLCFQCSQDLIIHKWNSEILRYTWMGKAAHTASCLMGRRCWRQKCDYSTVGCDTLVICSLVAMCIATWAFQTCYELFFLNIFNTCTHIFCLYWDWSLKTYNVHLYSFLWIK